MAGAGAVVTGVGSVAGFGVVVGFGCAVVAPDFGFDVPDLGFDVVFACAS